MGVIVRFTAKYLILLVAANMSMISVAQGRIFYVNAAQGDDGQNGLSRESAFQSMTRAAAEMAAGDTCLVQAGVYDERITVTVSGEPAQPVCFTAEGRVLMRGFRIEADHVHIEGFEIADTEQCSYTDGAGIYVRGAFCHITENFIHNTASVGIYLGHSNFSSPRDDPAYSQCTVIGNRIKGTRYSGLFVTGRNHQIENNDISHQSDACGGCSGNDVNGVTFFGAGHLFRNNRIHDIYKCESRGDPHIDGMQTWGPAYDIVFDGNFIDMPENNHQGFMIEAIYDPVRNLSFINNVFIMNASSYAPGINVHSKSGQTRIENITVVHNTFIGTGEAKYLVRLDGCTNITVKNNVFHYPNASGYSQLYWNFSNSIDLDVGGNAWSIPQLDLPYGDLDLWPDDRWGEDPGFCHPDSHDFHLRIDSPLIDAGIPIDGVGADFDGKARPQGAGSDIGAFETAPELNFDDPFPGDGVMGVYFVDGVNGDDGNDGTSPSSAFRTIGRAAGAIRAGDNCLVQEGIYNEKVRLVSSGHMEAPVTIKAEGRAVVRGFEIMADHVHISGFEITEFDPENSVGGAGISVQGAYCQIRNNFIHDTRSPGIMLGAFEQKGSEEPPDALHCTVEGNTLCANGHIGVQVTGQGHLIKNNDIGHPSGTGTKGLITGAAGILLLGSGHRLTGNRIHDLHQSQSSEGSVLCGLITRGPAQNIFFDGNFISMPADGGRGMLISSEAGPVYGLCITNNIIVTHAAGGAAAVVFEQWESSAELREVVFANNDIIAFDPAVPQLSILSGHEIKIHNNIFYYAGTAKASSQGFISQAGDVEKDHNLFFIENAAAPYGSANAQPQELWGANPHFTDLVSHDFSLTPASPCIDAGLALPGLSGDFHGNPRPQGREIDIGAIEFMGDRITPPENLRVIFFK